jgi:hypothetical protein
VAVSGNIYPPYLGFKKENKATYLHLIGVIGVVLGGNFKDGGYHA